MSPAMLKFRSGIAELKLRDAQAAHTACHWVEWEQRHIGLKLVREFNAGCDFETIEALVVAMQDSVSRHDQLTARTHDKLDQCRDILAEVNNDSQIGSDASGCRSPSGSISNPTGSPKSAATISSTHLS